MINYIILAIFATGLLLISKGVLEIVKIFSCKKSVEAFFMETSKERYGKGWVLFHTYSYRYEGKDYYTKSSLGVTQKLIESRYIGSQYTIFINEKNPRKFVAERKVSVSAIVWIVLGALVALLPLMFFLWVELS